MKSLERRFKIFEERNPLLSSWTCFCLAIDGQEFSKQTLGKWFSLVSKDDFVSDEKKYILSHINNLNLKKYEKI